MRALSLRAWAPGHREAIVGREGGVSSGLGGRVWLGVHGEGAAKQRQWGEGQYPEEAGSEEVGCGRTAAAAAAAVLADRICPPGARCRCCTVQKTLQKADKAMHSAAKLLRCCRRRAGVEDGDGLARLARTERSCARVGHFPHVAMRFKGIARGREAPRHVDKFGGVPVDM